MWTEKILAIQEPKRAPQRHGNFESFQSQTAQVSVHIIEAMHICAHMARTKTYTDQSWNQALPANWRPRGALEIWDVWDASLVRPGQTGSDRGGWLIYMCTKSKGGASGKGK